MFFNKIRFIIFVDNFLIDIMVNLFFIFGGKLFIVIGNFLLDLMEDVGFVDVSVGNYNFELEF